jgi:hypothetical protein
LAEDRIVFCLYLHFLLVKHDDVAESLERSKGRNKSLQQKRKVLSLEVVGDRRAFILDNVSKRSLVCIVSQVVRNLGVVAEEEERSR